MGVESQIETMERVEGIDRGMFRYELRILDQVDVLLFGN
jgi:hypothetical protein